MGKAKRRIREDPPQRRWGLLAHEEGDGDADDGADDGGHHQSGVAVVQDVPDRACDGIRQPADHAASTQAVIVDRLWHQLGMDLGGSLRRRRSVITEADHLTLGLISVIRWRSCLWGCELGQHDVLVLSRHETAVHELLEGLRECPGSDLAMADSLAHEELEVAVDGGRDDGDDLATMPHRHRSRQDAATFLVVAPDADLHLVLFPDDRPVVERAERAQGVCLRITARSDDLDGEVEGVEESWEVFPLAQQGGAPAPFTLTERKCEFHLSSCVAWSDEQLTLAEKHPPVKV